MRYKYDGRKHPNTKFEKLKWTNKFKYFGEWIQPNRIDKKVNKVRGRKIELAYTLVQNRCNKRAMFYKEHTTTRIEPEGLYSTQCLILNEKMEKPREV